MPKVVKVCVDVKIGAGVMLRSVHGRGATRKDAEANARERAQAFVANLAADLRGNPMHGRN